MSTQYQPSYAQPTPVFEIRIPKAARAFLRRSAIALTAMILVGCQSAPFSPIATAQSAETNSYDTDSENGFVWSSLFGKKKQETPPAENGTTKNSAIRQVSAESSLSEIDRPLQASSIPTETVDPLEGLEERIHDEDDPLEMSGFDLESLAPENVFKNLQAAIGLGPNLETAKTAYREGRDLYKQGKYREAAKKFKKAAGRWPDSLLEESALFFQAEAHFLADDYPKSFDAIGELLKKYENTRHLDLAIDRLFRIGQYWEQKSLTEPHWPITPNLIDKTQPRFDAFGYALKSYEMIALHDPTGPLADDSIMTIANAYFNRNRFEDAASYYDRIREDYPQSEYQIKAHLLGMKSKEEMYQGPTYNGTPLEEADKIAEQALRQFGNRLGDDYQLIVDARARFHAKMAERDWAMAKYWENKKAYGAARYYYHNLIQKYPATPVAHEAENRLVEIKDFSDKPKDQFAWLNNMFEDKLDQKEGQVIDLTPEEKTPQNPMTAVKDFILQ